ncbi:acetylglutamate kinase [Salipaludibacillus daqingensis]|uniref:acetylglutamate kinase n=1 Tax=Salipaludibacillus daqingensis TaxID=3041001 RepID=UPI0024764B3B|nr:acetylglutamate kinase [Salipaludibacillus daqingensis]
MDIIVFKLGGSILAKLPNSFFETLVKVKQDYKCQPVIVHGGGPEITEALNKWNVKSTFVNGLRVTTADVLHVAEMVLSGSLNKQIVANIQRAGGSGIGLSGVDGSLLTTKPLDSKLGFVGEVSSVNNNMLNMVINQDSIPVISPIGIDADGQKYNINADMAAAAIAIALKGKLAFISDVPGVMEEKSSGSYVYPELTKSKIKELIQIGVITGGMIPKVQSALSVLEAGVSEAVILNGCQPADVTQYIQGNPVGTKVVHEEAYYV